MEKKIEDNNRELHEKNKELTRINNDLDNFIYTASHDLKAPVSNIEGLIYSLKKDFEDKTAVRARSRQIVING